MKEIRKIRE